MFRKIIHIIPAVLVVVALSLPANAEAGSKQHRNLRGRPAAQYIQANAKHDHSQMSGTASGTTSSVSKQWRNTHGRPIQHYR